MRAYHAPRCSRLVKCCHIGQVGSAQSVLVQECHLSALRPKFGHSFLGRLTESLRACLQSHLTTQFRHMVHVSQVQPMCRGDACADVSSM